jgi:hypothetical protein
MIQRASMIVSAGVIEALCHKKSPAEAGLFEDVAVA